MMTKSQLCIILSGGSQEVSNVSDRSHETRYISSKSTVQAAVQISVLGTKMGLNIEMIFIAVARTQMLADIFLK